MIWGAEFEVSIPVKGLGIGNRALVYNLQSGKEGRADKSVDTHLRCGDEVLGADGCEAVGRKHKVERGYGTAHGVGDSGNTGTLHPAVERSSIKLNVSHNKTNFKQTLINYFSYICEMETNNSTKLVIYKMPNGEPQLDVTVQGETIWLTQRQIAELFGTKVPAISKHLKNIYASGELERDATISKMETIVNRGFRGSSVENVDHYNLDAILSVGYRVNSKNATAFRIWANRILKQYLLQGYAVNQRIATQKYDELSQLVKVLGRAIRNQNKLTEDSRALLDVVVDYTYALDTLDRYDYQELKIEGTTKKKNSMPHTTMQWRLSVSFTRNSAAAHCSATRKTIPSKAPSARYIRHSVV